MLAGSNWLEGKGNLKVELNGKCQRSQLNGWNLKGMLKQEELVEIIKVKDERDNRMYSASDEVFQTIFLSQPEQYFLQSSPWPSTRSWSFIVAFPLILLLPALATKVRIYNYLQTTSILNLDRWSTTITKVPPASQWRGFLQFPPRTTRLPSTPSHSPLYPR